jgi:FHA domain
MSNPIILKIYDGGKLKLARAFREGRVRMGSGAVDLVLDGPGVAPHHAVIELGAMGTVIRALSPAPVLLNGQPILAAPLRHGDLISLGEVRVMVEMRATAHAPGAQAPSSGQGPRPRLQLIQGEEESERPLALAHAAPALAVVREDEEQRIEEQRVEDGLPPAGHESGYPVEDALAQPKPQVSGPPAEAPEAVTSCPFEAPPPSRTQPPEERAILESGPTVAPGVPHAPASAAPAPLQPHAQAASLDGGARSCAQVEMFWGDTRLSVWQLEPGQELVAGTSEGCAALLEGIERATVVRCDGGGWVVSAPRPLSLTLIENGVTIGGSELLARGRGQADAHGIRLALPSDATGVIGAGAVQLRVRRVALATRAPKEPSDWKGVLAASIAAIFFVGLMRVLSHAIPMPPHAVAMPEVIRPRPMVVRAAVKPVDPATPHERNAKSQGRRDPGVAVARHSGLEGQAGSPTAQRRDARAQRKTDERALVANTGLLKALGGKGQSDLFGVALERGTRDALGHLTGPRVADARGSGGMGLRSLGGTGGGGDGSGLGLARIGTNGIGGGLASYGEGKGGLKGKSDAEIGLTPGQPQVVGRIDPELIRKVVHDHRAQIRTCYEMQLNARPNLAGKLVAAWTIDAQGDVVEAHTQESALHDRTVESCVSGKIKTWHFPIPKGGGEVFVTYPFIFTPGG